MTNACLFQPLQLGDIIIQNRIGMSALTRSHAPDAIPGDLLTEHHIQRTLGAAGLIVTEGILVTRQDTEWPHVPGIWDSEQTSAWKKTVGIVHRGGGRIYAQLLHAAHPDDPEQKLAGTPVCAPSGIPARGGKFRHIPGIPGYVTPNTVPDPQVMIDQFKQAAVNAKLAGFDGVELHGANGYLIAQFLDSMANTRTDRWGGSIENRSRFGLEVLKAVIQVFGRNVAIKVSPSGRYNDVGMPFQETLDTYSYFIVEADKLNLSYITLLRDTAHANSEIEIDGKKGAVHHDVLECYGPYIKNAKIFLDGAVSPEEAAILISAGKIDGAFIGLDWITHPELAKRVLHEKPLGNVLEVPHTVQGKPAQDWAVGYTGCPAAIYETML